ncbi:hypothetical protein [Geodermatophilus sp. SYSU D01176]
MSRLRPGDVACWVLKSTRPPERIEPGWRVGTAIELTRCVRRSYRLDLLHPGQPVLLWVSGRTAPGVHALGEVTGEAEEHDGGPVVAVRLARLPAPVPRAALLADPTTRDAEVLRMAAGSNPSWLSPEQYAAVLAHLPPHPQGALGPWPV